MFRGFGVLRHTEGDLGGTSTTLIVNVHNPGTSLTGLGRMVSRVLISSPLYPNPAARPTSSDGHISGLHVHVSPPSSSSDLPPNSTRAIPLPCHSIGAWTDDDSKHRHTSCCRKRQFHLELHRSRARFEVQRSAEGRGCAGYAIMANVPRGGSISSVSFPRRVGRYHL